MCTRAADSEAGQTRPVGSVRGSRTAGRWSPSTVHSAETVVAVPRALSTIHLIPGAFLLAERPTGIRLTEADLSEPGDRIAVGIHPD